MSVFEIHGDDENGVTITMHGVTRTFDVLAAPLFKSTPRSYDHYSSLQSGQLELTLYRRPEVLDATPTVYGEGVWLH